MGFFAVNCYSVDLRSYDTVILPSTGTRFFDYLLTKKQELDSLSVLSISGGEWNVIHLIFEDYKKEYLLPSEYNNDIKYYSFSMLKLNDSLLVVYLTSNPWQLQRDSLTLYFGSSAIYLVNIREMRILEKMIEK